MGTNKLFAKMKAANRAQAKILRGDTMGDFRVTQAGLDAITSNLLTTQTQLGRKLTAANRRTLDHMQRTAHRSNRSIGRTVNRGESFIRGNYGSAVAANPEAMRMAGATQSAARATLKGEVKAGKGTAKAGNQALDILKAAARTAANSGQYELAMALRERTQADAETIAASKLALQQTRLDFKLGEIAADNEAERNEDYLRLQNRLQNGGQGGEGFESAAAYIQELSANGATDAELNNEIDALRYQFNLGPQQLSKLRGMVTALTGSSGGGGDDEVISSPAAQAYTKEYGYSPVSTLPDSAESDYNGRTWAAFDPSGEVPSFEEALKIAGLQRTGDGHWTTGAKDADGEYIEVDEQYVAATVAYVQSSWMRIAAQQATDSSSYTGGGTGGSKKK